MSRRNDLFSVTIAVLSLLMLLWGTAIAAEPKRGGTLHVAYGNRISHLDFHTAPGYEMMWVAMNVGCGLVNITPDGQFVPDAAESWEVAKDGKTYTFKLRDHVYFHDGTKLDAEAVAAPLSLSSGSPAITWSWTVGRSTLKQANLTWTASSSA
ncbi:MAG: ABC transporter substrate-binding protein [Candidatus Entotheonellia bacterium]